MGGNYKIRLVHFYSRLSFWRNLVLVFQVLAQSIEVKLHRKENNFTRKISILRLHVQFKYFQALVKRYVAMNYFLISTDFEKKHLQSSL